jgi:nucleotide-binding universal stress UspA family protein
MPGILVGIDGSAHSHHALEWAISEAASRHAPLTVLTVTQPFTGHWGAPVPDPGDLTRDARDAAQQETESVLEKAGRGSRPPSVTVRAVTGMPGDELLNAAAGADMIVVGCRGTGGFKRLRMGAVSLQVTHHAHCPVVVIPDDNI